MNRFELFRFVINGAICGSAIAGTFSGSHEIGAVMGAMFAIGYLCAIPKVSGDKG